MIIAILQSQLEASNETVKRLNATIESMEASFNATISELKATISRIFSRNAMNLLAKPPVRCAG